MQLVVAGLYGSISMCVSKIRNVVADGSILISMS